MMTQPEAVKGFMVCLSGPDVAIDLQVGKAFAEAVRSMELLRRVADVVELVRTNSRAARSEWNGAGLPSCDVMPVRRRDVSSCLTELLNRGYEPRCTLLVGGGADSLEAARQTGAFFFPILPGREEQCWHELAEEALPKLLHGTFGGRYQQLLLARHNSVYKQIGSSK